MTPWHLLRGWGETTDRWVRRDGEALWLGPLVPSNKASDNDTPALVGMGANSVVSGRQLQAGGS